MMIRSSAALCGTCMLLWHCAADTLDRESYCVELPQAVCERLFDEACGLPGLVEGGARYADRETCEAAEQSACRELIDEQQAFDEQEAFACVEQVKLASCGERERADFHDCDKVFVELEPAAAPIETESN